ncbi:MAG: helix-turn-helix transcriptional regulator [Oscillospiraceae bacterium]|nr:helix-turn-helix transcriptional regulator [Oscillospiraceae bacterium]
MHKICEGRKPLSKATVSQWREESTDIRSNVSNYFCNEMVAVRKNVDAILQSMGLPREYLAKAAGMDVTLMSLWFSQHRRNLSMTHAAAFAEILHCTCSELLLGEQKPIYPPKRVALFCKTVAESKATYKTAVALLTSLPKRDNVTPDALMYERMVELATDKMCLLEVLLEPCRPDYRLNVKQLIKAKRFVGRLPALFGICTIMDIPPDYLMRLDYTASPIIVDGKRVGDKYLQILGQYLSVASEDQDKVLGALLEKAL